MTFAAPMLIGNIFQQSYNIIDSIIVGQLIGKEALAAVGASFPIIFALISFVIGIASGGTIVVSQYFGAKDYLWNIPEQENELKETKNDPNATYYPKGELVITKFGTSNDKTNAEFKLVYMFDIYASSKSERIFTDANSGSVIYSLPLESDCEPSVSFNSIFNGSRSIQTEKYTASDYRLRDDCQATVIWVRDWTSATSTPPPSYDEIENTTNTWTTIIIRIELNNICVNLIHTE